MDFEKNELTFIPLGGSEQFGMNLNVYGYDGKWLAVDCGIGFADESYPGIDILLPDPGFLTERKKDVVALIVTHAHEDHIGAVPYLWPRLRCPIYCTPFAAAVLRQKLRDHPDCREAEIHTVKPGATIKAGPFRATFIAVSHSIPETRSLIIETALGTVVHTGDWNLDPTPAIGTITESAPFAAAGEKGVLACIGDSTNAEVEETSFSEADVKTGMQSVFETCKGRIAVTIFASNIGRIRSICHAAKACGRSVALIGRSLHRMVGAAKECGYLKDVTDFVGEDDIGLIPHDRIVMIVTGSQGEQRAQMARIARGEHPSIRLGRKDTVIFSSRAIPGNEREIITVKNNLAAAGVRIVTTRDTDQCIHISGHPARQEIRRMLGWIKPAALIPVHGERTMLEAHAALGRECGVPTTIVPNNGSVIRLAPGEAAVIGHVETGLLAVEPGRVIKADHPAIGQRRKLQFSGAVHVTLVMDARGDLAADPKISTVGLADTESPEGQRFENAILGEIDDILADLTQEELYDDTFVSEEIRIGVRRFVDHTLKIKPKAVVHLVRI